ncbi:type VI secretion system baseplate subunit TssK [Neptunomonas sp.]|uniref:type VI secretion system baseplate subunit TssK n=1 Tax=Neptunomonas sp. TaxID=1971898 RepID=UPI0025CC9819|nr:type VI secretion system baseplate subunit TssK [Neptunomonas sp.]
MSQSARVIWSEGMFLRPHHYQQYTRFVENLIEERCTHLRPFSWGVVDFQIDQKLLGLGKVSISQARGVFQDGTPFSIPSNDEPPLAIDIPEDIKDCVVYLCIPLQRSGTADIDNESDPDSLARYSPIEIETQDNCSIGGSMAAIRVGKLRMRLMLEKHHRDEYACLGIGRIVEVRADKSLLMDENFLLPSLDCRASPGLVSFMKELTGLLKHRADALAGRIVVSGRGGAAEIADFLLLQAVNRYSPLITHLASLRGYHPESFYQFAVSMAGEMATFTATNKIAPEFDIYQHDNLQKTFAPVFESLRQSLSMVLEQTAVSIPLQERKYGIRVAIVSDESLLQQASFVLAVSSDTPAEDVRQRFPAQVKIGPTEQIRQLVNVQLPGIRIRPMPVAPRQIPYHTGYVYFELEKSGDLWGQLNVSGGVAIHIGGEFPNLKLELWAIRQ